MDFVYIDADHSYEGARRDIAAWGRKVRRGGMVAGHDYYVFPGSGNDGVVRAVDEHIAETGAELQTTEWDKENPDQIGRAHV